MSTATDWQELAYRGHTVEAIKAHRVALGVGLAEAKTAVERWMAINMPPSLDYQRCSSAGRKVANELDRYIAETGTEINFAVNIIPDKPQSVVGLATVLAAQLSVDRPVIDLVVDVVMTGVKTSISWEAARRHIRDGVRAAWVIDPDDRSVTVYTEPNEGRVLKGDKVLDGGTVLPRFSCKVADVFA